MKKASSAKRDVQHQSQDFLPNGNWIIRRGDRVLVREMMGDEGALVLHLDTTAYFQLNRSGVEVWRLLEDAVSLGALSESVRSRLANVPAEFEEHLYQFIMDLAERDLVRLEPRG
jgi:hypothetical protein